MSKIVVTFEIDGEDFSKEDLQKWADDAVAIVDDSNFNWFLVGAPNLDPEVLDLTGDVLNMWATVEDD